MKKLDNITKTGLLIVTLIILPAVVTLINEIIIKQSPLQY